MTQATKRLKKRQVVTPEEVLAECSVEVRAIASRLRRIIKQTVPAASEVTARGWRGLGYRHPHHGYVCGIFLQADSVKLGFEHGVNLHDPDYLFEPSNGQVKYIKLADRKQIREVPLRKLLTAAMHLQGEPS